MCVMEKYSGTSELRTRSASILSLVERLSYLLYFWTGLLKCPSLSEVSPYQHTYSCSNSLFRVPRFQHIFRRLGVGIKTIPLLQKVSVRWVLDDGSEEVKVLLGDLIVQRFKAIPLCQQGLIFYNNNHNNNL